MPAKFVPIATLTGLVALNTFSAYAASSEQSAYQRSCQVVDGTVVCSTRAEEFANLSAGEKGFKVYDRTDSRHGPIMGYGGPGYGDSQSRLVATITDNNGNQRVREVRLRYLENTPEGNMRLVIFDRPRDLKRHALLTISRKQGLDEQWTYNPDNKQVKRIMSNNAFTPFSGTDIAFEDFSSQDIGKYDYEYLRDDRFNATPCHVINRFPKDQYSGYSRLETWVSKDNYLVQKIDYYDRKNRLLKTLTLDNYRLYSDKYWRASEMLMTNHRSGRTTRLNWSGYEFNTGLSKNDFSLTELRNIN